MTSPPPKHPKKSGDPGQSAPKTFLGSITQAFHTVQANIDFAKIPLKPNARVPRLVVEGSSSHKTEEYPLVGEHYILGRSSKNCDIVVRSPIVSQTHLSLTRDRSRPGNPFVLKDQGSTNGIYRKKKRLSKFPLRHGDTLTLGPEELADAVTVRYIDPPPWHVLAIRYGIMGASGITGLIVLWIVALEWPKVSINPLPESVQGPVLVISGEEGGDRTPLNELPSIAHRENKRLQEYSDYLPKALVASEDSRFYWHPGVDPLGIARALKANVAQGSIREGASTLTQQLARNTFRDYVGTEDSAQRKIREAIVALKIETFYSKDAIMLLYLNRVYLGNNLYGFEDASQFYFDKSAADLTINEAATLVGILPAPNAFNPVQDYEAAVDYRNRVIERMVASGSISAEEGRTARRSRIEISPKAREQLKSALAPYFYSYIFDELDEVLGTSLAREGNFIVETSLNLQTQEIAEKSLRDAVNNEGPQFGYSQGSIVTLNTQTGEIEALVGGADYAESQFNRATQAYRQPGSTFKVFAYAAALEQGFSPSETFSCAPLNWDGVSFSGCASGGSALDMYAGLARSENPVALRIAQAAGLDSVISLAKRMGIESELASTPGLVLGQSEVIPLEITGAFAAIANEGVWNRPHGIQRVIDSSDCEDFNDRNTCRIVYDFADSSESNQPVLDPYVANTMVSMMQGAVQGGTGRSAALGLGEGGKTGTTNDGVDIWFIGFVPRNGLVTSVWLGNDDNTPTYSSSDKAARVWGSYMAQVLR